MALSVQSLRAYDPGHTAISFSYFVSVSPCNVRCFETEIILWYHNLCEQHAILTMSHRPPSAVFLEESKRLYTVCCATVS